MKQSPLWQHFYHLCTLPHPTFHTEQVRLYILDYVEGLGLESKVDKAGNILVKKPATPGLEFQTGIALQAHLDMVPQANGDTLFDFEKDPIRPQLIAKGEDSEYPEEELLKATGTTLGADNGIGVAAMLTILGDKDLKHGPLECLFTVDEEIGMGGANALSSEWLESLYMLNLDTETEGQLMTGCAGAVDMVATFGYRMDAVLPEGDVAVCLSLGGLKGGHSGMDIQLGRGNAIKLMNRFLKHIVVNFEARLASFKGGSLRNAIPREATAIITVPSEAVPELLDEVSYYQELFRYELRGVDDGVVFSGQICETPAVLIPEEVQDDILNAIEACHDGVLRYAPGQAVVETSSNLASIETMADETRVIFLIRSMNEEMKRALSSRLQSAFLLAGARVDFEAAYKGWELPQDASLLKRATAIYEGILGRKPETSGVHCGLECGIIGALYPRMEILSIGPTIHHPHSPYESVETESVERFWIYLKALLEHIDNHQQAVFNS